MALRYVMTLLIWSVKGPYSSMTSAISKSAEIGQTFLFHYVQEDQVSVKFGFSML